MKSVLEQIIERNEKNLKEMEELKEETLELIGEEEVTIFKVTRGYLVEMKVSKNKILLRKRGCKIDADNVEVKVISIKKIFGRSWIFTSDQNKKEIDTNHAYYKVGENVQMKNTCSLKKDGIKWLFCSLNEEDAIKNYR